MLKSLSVAVVLCMGSAYAQLDAETFLTPPKAVADLVTAPRHLNVTLSNLSPNGRLFLITRSAGMPTIAQLARPYLELGGEMVDPHAFRDRTINIRGLIGLELYDWQSGKRSTIDIPTGATVSAPEWSPDGNSLAFLANFDSGSRLYVADCGSGRSRQIGRGTLLTTNSTKLQWVDGGKALVAVFVPDGVGAPPNAPQVPDQPIVRVADAKKNSIRTYASLLKDKNEARLFEFYTTGQLARVDLNGRVTTIGKPGMIRTFDASPDGRYYRVTTTLKPFSYIVPVSSFGQKEELWNEAGGVVSELSKRELTFDDAPVDPGPNPTGGPRGRGQGGQGGADSKRNIAWRPDGQGLSYLQTEPRPEGGEPGGLRKDRVMQWVAPFGAKDTKVIFETPDRMTSVRYSADCQTLFISESKTGSENTYAARLSAPDKRLPISSRKTDDFYGNPGTLLVQGAPNGVSCVRITPAGAVMLGGIEYSKTPEKEAPRPFMDAVDITTGTKTRVWQSASDNYETLSVPLNPDCTKLMLLRQSPSMIPASFTYDTGSKALSKTIDNTDYAAVVTQAPRYRVRVTRADGLQFWCSVTMPKWASKGMRLPAFFWFYPDEYRDQKGYDESKRTYNKNAFPTIGASSKDFLTTQGYVVVEPDCPIIGTATAINDNYVSDLRMNLAATIDTLDREGYIDRDKLAIGGHSYGAFSTVNAMIQTPFFKAGIAGDGSYNRTLTPFGFQTEQRKLWEAKWTYLEMSPLLNIERLTGALLLYHSINDQNVGTDPINAPRLFGALEALGKPAALYMYPYEDHGQVARETLLDLWARWVGWLDKYVKGSKE